MSRERCRCVIMCDTALRAPANENASNERKKSLERSRSGAILSNDIYPGFGRRQELFVY